MKWIWFQRTLSVMLAACIGFTALQFAFNGTISEASALSQNANAEVQMQVERPNLRAYQSKVNLVGYSWWVIGAENYGVQEGIYLTTQHNSITLLAVEPTVRSTAYGGASGEFTLSYWHSALHARIEEFHPAKFLDLEEQGVVQRAKETFNDEQEHSPENSSLWSIYDAE